MPAYSLYLLQPLNVGCFSPLKRAYSDEISSSQHSLTIHNPGDKEEGQAWLCLPTTPISFDTGMAKPSTKALLAQSYGLGSTEHRLSTPTLSSLLSLTALNCL